MSQIDPKLLEYRLETEIEKEYVVHKKVTANGKEIFERWDQDKERIGSGGFASVWRQRKEGTAELRAVKKMAKDGGGELGRYAERELSHLVAVRDVSIFLSPVVHTIECQNQAHLRRNEPPWLALTP